MNIKTAFFIFLLAGQSFHLQAQADSLDQDKARLFTIRGFGFAGIEYSKVADLSISSTVAGASILINGHYEVGFFGTWNISGDLVQQIIFPNDYDMNYIYGGLVVGYRSKSIGSFNFFLESRFGHGEVIWEELETGRNVLSDKMYTFEPQIGVDYSPIKFAKINVFAGYRIMNGLEIVNLTNSDFNGIRYGFLLKIGIIE